MKNIVLEAEKLKAYSFFIGDHGGVVRSSDMPNGAYIEKQKADDLFDDADELLSNLQLQNDSLRLEIEALRKKA